MAANIYKAYSRVTESSCMTLDIRNTTKLSTWLITKHTTCLSPFIKIGKETDIGGLSNWPKSQTYLENTVVRYWPSGPWCPTPHKLWSLLASTTHDT